MRTGFNKRKKVRVDTREDYPLLFATKMIACKLEHAAIIVHFDLWNTKRRFALKVHAFLFERLSNILG
jgi:hypothetical protein